MTPGHSDSAMVFRKAAPAVFLMIYAIGALIYGNSLPAPFYCDDLSLIRENPHIRLTRLTKGQIADAIKHNPADRILPVMTFAANYYLHQYRESGYHLTNLLIHVVNGWLVFCLAWQTFRLTGRKPFFPSLLTGLLWLVQPAHTQSVTYIVQRMNALAVLFYLLAMICYVRARTRQERGAGKGVIALWLSGCCLAGLAGLVSKQIVATLPAFIFLYEWFFFRNLDSGWLRRHWRRPLLAILLCVLFAGLYLGGHPLERIADTYHGKPFTPGQRLLTQPSVLVYYLSLLFYPHPDRLTLNYDFPLSRAVTDPMTTALALAALAALVVLAVKTARRQRLLSFAVFWYLGTLAVESSLIGLAMAFEHRLYLPSIFPAMAAAALLIRLLRSRGVAIILAGGLIIANGYWTYQRNITWQDRVSFWRDGCMKSPRLVAPRNDYGLALAEAGEVEKARTEYEKALVLPHGEKGPVHYNRGLLSYQSGDMEAAEDEFRQAIALQPGFAGAFTNLGIIATEKGNPVEALPLLETAVRLSPNDSDAHNALGRAYYQTGQVEPAIRHCRRALELDPENAAAENNLGAIFLGAGDAGKALPHLKKALELSPDLAEVNINIGIACDRLGDPVMAVFHLFRAVFLAPDAPAARAELGLFLLRQEKYQDTRTHLEKALALGPDFPELRMALAAALARQDLTDEAVAQYCKILADHPEHAEARQQLKALTTRSGNKADE
ncbi:MAG: tetratricopeptide repeat protein [Thermodesulfobacteriota bacterium]